MIGFQKASLKNFLIFLFFLFLVIFFEIFKISWIFDFHFNLFLIFLVFSLNYLGLFEALILGGAGFFIFDYLFSYHYLFFLSGILMILFFYFLSSKFFEKNNLFGILIFLFLGEIFLNLFFGPKNLISLSFFKELLPTLALGLAFWASLKLLE